MLRLSRVIVTSDNGRRQLEQQTERLVKHHEQVHDAQCTATEWIGEHHMSLKLYAVKVRVDFNPKRSTTPAQAKQWFAHKTRQWLYGYAVLELDEVKCVSRS